LKVFLEYDKDLSVRGKNRKEKLVGIFSSFQKTSDELLLASTMRGGDVDEFFEAEKHFLLDYHNQLKECAVKADKMNVAHKHLADNYIKLSQGLLDLASIERQQQVNGEAYL